MTDDRRPQSGPGGPVFANDIATAPGDLPVPEVMARLESRAGQFRHDNVITPLAPRPGVATTVTATAGTGVPVRRATLHFTTDGSEPDAGSDSVEMHVDRVEWAPQGGYLTVWSGDIPPLPASTVVRYRIGGWCTVNAGSSDPEIWAHDGQGLWFHFPGGEGLTTFAFPVEDPKPPMPDWVRDGVIYHIFLDRFHPGTPDGTWSGDDRPMTRHGGTLRGVKAALPHLADLGVTCIWFSPHCPSETYHRYDGIDFFGIDSDLGTADDMHELVAEVHRRGMRIWLDFVPNHCSWHHPAFELAQRDQNAPTFEWFTFNEWPHDYRTFMQATRTMPMFDVQNPGARQYLLDSALYWIREFDVDGYRLDHAIGPGMDFWTALRDTLQRVRRDVVTVGEATDTPDSLVRYRNRLHGILDFPLAKALRLAFGSGGMSAAEFEGYLSGYERFMAEGPGRVSFLDNHDMDRFLWVAGNDTDRLKSAALCQFTLDATPVIYYATEIGMSQLAGKEEAGFGGDAQARRNMPWNRDQWDIDLLAYYRELVALRHAHPALRRGSRETIHLDDAAGTFGYLRRGDAGTAAIAAVFNLSDETRELRISGEYSTLLATHPDCTARIDGTGTVITLSPHGGIALAAANAVK